MQTFLFWCVWLTTDFSHSLSSAMLLQPEIQPGNVLPASVGLLRHRVGQVKTTGVTTWSFEPISCYKPEMDSMCSPWMLTFWICKLFRSVRFSAVQLSTKRFCVSIQATQIYSIVLDGSRWSNCSIQVILRSLGQRLNTWILIFGIF